MYLSVAKTRNVVREKWREQEIIRTIGFFNVCGWRDIQLCHHCMSRFSQIVKSSDGGVK